MVLLILWVFHSCAGPQTYREHLEGQKHKKREAATKMAASVAVTSQNRAGNSLRCQLCDVTCTGIFMDFF